MSCILYTQGNYNAFEQRSALLQHLYVDMVRNTHYPTASSVAEFLFSLNADAYRMRYGRNDDVEDEIREAAADLSFDKLDYDFGQVKDWNNFNQVWHLLKRIRYQCSEFPEGHAGNDRMRLLNWMIDSLIELQMEKLSAVQGIPGIALQYC